MVFVIIGCVMLSLLEIKKSMTVEKVLSSICFVAGLVFLVVAIFGVWRHFFTMSLCVAVGVMISDNPMDSVKEKRRGSR